MSWIRSRRSKNPRPTSPRLGKRTEILAIQTTRHGKDHWEATDARLALAHVERLSHLSADQRRQLAEAAAWHTSSFALEKQGKYADAIALEKKVLEVRESALGEQDQLTARSVHWIGHFYSSSGDNAQAKTWDQKAVDLRKRLLGEMHPEYATSLSNLAYACRFAGDPVHAETLFRRVLEIRKAVLGERDADYLLTVNDLCDVLEHLAAKHQTAEDFAAARNERAEMLAIKTKRFGKDNWQVTDARLALAHVDRLSRLSAEQCRKVTEAAESQRKANSLFRQAKYSEAIVLSRKAFNLRKDLLGEDNLFSASSAYTLGNLYMTAGNYVQAEAWYKTALDLYKRAAGEKHPGYASSLYGLGLLYFNEGNYSKAEPLYQQSVAIASEMRSEKPAVYACALSGLATLYAATGEYAKSEQLTRQALAIQREVLGENSIDYAANLINLASLYQRLGDLAKAEPLFRRAMTIYKARVGDKNPDYARSLSFLAMLYAMKGELAKAEPLYQQALTIERQALGESHPTYACTLNNLAELYEEMGDDAKAEKTLRQAIEIQKEVLGEKNPTYATGLGNLASLYLHLGNYTKAESTYREALAIEKETIGEKHDNYASQLEGLGLVYHMMGEYSKAERIYRQALAIHKESAGERTPAYAASLNNLAGLYNDMGDYAKAEPLYRQALALGKEVLGEKHAQYANWLSNFAFLYEDMGEPAKAEPFATKAMQIALEHLEMSASAESERQQFRAADSVRADLNSFLAISAEAKVPAEKVYTEILAWKGGVSARQQAMRRMRQTVGTTHAPDVALLFDELTTASRELANQSLVVPAPDRLAEHRQRLTQLSDRVEQLQQELASKSQTFRRQLQQRHRTPKDIQQVLPRDAALVDLFEYDHYASPTEKGGKPVWQRRLVAFVVRSDKPIERIELGAALPIVRLIDAWRRNFGGSGDQTIDPGQELRRTVWEKLEPYLQDVKTVLISPDGATARFPWPALPGKKSGSYLIEDVAIAIVPIPRLLPELLANNQLPQNESPSLLLVGGVDFGADPGPIGDVATDRIAAHGDQPLHWRELPGTATEVESIKATFARRYAQLVPLELTGSAATKLAVRDLMPKCRYLHFSTHGFFSPPAVKPASAIDARNAKAGSEGLLTRQDVSGFHPDLLSGLVLAGANRPVVDGQADGILTALEVSGLDLSHVELATLSACETGLGESAGGEGLLGLQRAFQLAGAKTTVASLWQVPDKATQLLMDRFYENLWNRDRKMSKLDALLNAQRWMLREGRKQAGLARGIDLGPAESAIAPTSGRLSPRYWAAFVLSGDWR